MAGNQGAALTAFQVTIDTVAPVAPVIGNVIDNVAPVVGLVADNGSSNDTTLTLAGTAETGSTVTLYDTDGTTVLGSGVATGGAFLITTSVLAEGTHTLTATATDAAGNQGAASTAFHVTIDTLAPLAPSISSIPENSGGGIDASEASDGTPVVVGLTGTGAVAGDTLAIDWGGQIVNYTLLAADISGSSATVTVPLATIEAQGNGTFDVTARLTDAAGNASPDSAVTPVTVDITGGGSGDVHMITFDGLHYDFQAVGDFVAVQSTDPGNAWEVQIRTDPWAGAVSVTTALGALIGDDRVTFAVGPDSVVHLDGAPDVGLHPGVTQALTGGTLTQLSDDTYHLDWNMGESVTVIDRGTYLDWTVALGPHDGPGSVHGLLGSNTGQTSDDFQLHDGTVLAQPLSEDQILSVFAPAWSVTPGTSLLDETTPYGLSGGAGNDILSSGSQGDWPGEVYRLYEATLNRAPDPAGFDYWIDQLRGGTSLSAMASSFTSSHEFQSTYGSLDDTQFLTLLYNNTLDRAPDPVGLAYWLNQIGTGMSRNDVVLGFSESPESMDIHQAGVQDYVHLVVPSAGDVLDGGAGQDTASYALAKAGVTVDLGVSGPQETFGSGVDTLVNIENLVGSSFGDTLTGNASANVLTGGQGADTFRYTAVSQSAPGAYDTITDFVHGQDKIDLSAIAGLGNSLSSTTTAPATIDPHALVAYISGGNTFLYVNATASSQTIATADMEIHLIGVTNLSNGDLNHHA